MADFTKLQEAISKLVEQVTVTEGTEASAVALITGFSTAISTAVASALQKDNAADDATALAAQTAIDEVTARYKNSAAALGAAVASNPQFPTVKSIIIVWLSPWQLLRASPPLAD